MLYQYMRILNSDNGILTDYSIENQENGAVVPMALTTGEDYLYIGQHYPFNNLFFQLDTPNTVTATVKVEYWDSTDWIEAVDVLDATKSNGKSMAKDGSIQFTPNSLYNWGITSDTNSGPRPTELSAVTIYNMYWLRLSFNATLTAGADLKRIAYSFSTHQQLSGLDTTINSYLTSFSATKTSWDDEIIVASMQLVDDLKRRGLIVNRGQVLLLDDVSRATDWKALMLIYHNLGGDYKEKRLNAIEEYTAAASITRFSFDQNANALLERSEYKNTISRMVR